jgi:NADPH:quinone reductase
MVGGATTDQSLAALAPFGRLVVFGMASRQNPSPVEVGELMARSRAVVGFWLDARDEGPGAPPRCPDA